MDRRMNCSHGVRIIGTASSPWRGCGPRRLSSLAEVDLVTVWRSASTSPRLSNSLFIPTPRTGRGRTSSESTDTLRLSALHACTRTRRRRYAPGGRLRVYTLMFIDYKEIRNPTRRPRVSNAWVVDIGSCTHPRHDNASSHTLRTFILSHTSVSRQRTINVTSSARTSSSFAAH